MIVIEGAIIQRPAIPTGVPLLLKPYAHSDRMNSRGGSRPSRCLLIVHGRVTILDLIRYPT